MENIDRIISKELQRDLISLKEDVFNICVDINVNVDRIQKYVLLKTLEKYIHRKYVFGCGGPICICDCSINGNIDSFDVCLGVNYKVTSWYLPYQDLDEIIQLKFKVNKETIRNQKIENLLCH